MNLKYYLRGLGIGIIVTAVIMSIAGKDSKESLSDAEIRARAAQLGMVEESGLLSDLTTEELKPTEEPKSTGTPKPTEEPKPTKTPKATEAPKEEEEPKTTEEPKATKAPSTKPAVEMVDFNINQGESSYTICKRLKEYGLIASAEDFDTYLCDQGLDKRLQAGKFSIPEDATPKEIAEILTF